MKITLDLNHPGNFPEEMDDLLADEDECVVPDGLYFSKHPPISRGTIEFDTEEDYIAQPYDTGNVFVWKGERPTKIDYNSKAYKPGLALTFEAKEPGFYTTAFEDD